MEEIKVKYFTDDIDELCYVEGKSDCPRDALNICRMLSLKPEILAMIEENY